MKTSKLENLIAGHAYWADKKAELKAQSLVEFHSCDGMDTAGEGNNFHSFGKSCYERAHIDHEECMEESGPYESPNFIDSFEAIEPCEHCVKHRDLKSKAAIASRRLGQIRSAMTRVGRKLEYTDKTVHFGENYK